MRLKLKTLRSDITAGVRAPASYTVQAAVDDWLADGLSGLSERTLTLYRDGVKPLTDRIGARQLRKLTAAEVRSALAGLSGELSTRSLQIARNCLVRAIRQAEADDIVARNVAALVKTPAGQEGKPSKALTVEQAQALVQAAAGVLRANGMRKRRGPYRLHAYVVLLLTTGIRPEEARALRWDLSTWRPGRCLCGGLTGPAGIPRRPGRGGRSGWRGSRSRR